MKFAFQKPKILLQATVFAFLCAIPPIYSQHTFSIVAIDSITGEIGSAGATCGDSIIWPGTPGAYIISDIIPGVGAIHTQAYWQTSNQQAAHSRMLAGDSPEEIIQYMITHDVQSNPHIRQYGVVDYNGGHSRSAGYTGMNCMDYKNHITGPGYAIQGNILLGSQILDSMESRFLNTSGSLADRLMAALQGAKVIGADSRCIPDSTSSLSSFLRVAKPSDHPDSLYLDINVAGTAQWVDPIDVVQTKYNNWLLWIGRPAELPASGIELYPNPADLFINVRCASEGCGNSYILTDVSGKIVGRGEINHQYLKIPANKLENGTYFLSFLNEKHPPFTVKVLVLHP